MTFVTDNEKVYDKYNEIWEVIRKLLKVKFAVNPVRDDKYLVAKLKIFNKINRTTFNNENNIPTERNYYICIPAKLCSESIMPIINITKKEHIKENNKHIKDIIDNLENIKDI